MPEAWAAGFLSAWRRNGARPEELARAGLEEAEGNQPGRLHPSWWAAAGVQPDNLEGDGARAWAAAWFALEHPALEQAPRSLPEDLTGEGRRQIISAAAAFGPEVERDFRARMDAPRAEPMSTEAAQAFFCAAARTLSAPSLADLLRWAGAYRYGWRHRGAPPRRLLADAQGTERILGRAVLFGAGHGQF